MLLDHLSAANAAKHGVSIEAEAVANDKHTLYLIAEAADEEQRSRASAPSRSRARSSCWPPLRARWSSTAVAALRFSPDVRLLGGPDSRC
jgi:hypothetical protein